MRRTTIYRIREFISDKNITWIAVSASDFVTRTTIVNRETWNYNEFTVDPVNMNLKTGNPKYQKKISKENSKDAEREREKRLFSKICVRFDVSREIECEKLVEIKCVIFSSRKWKWISCYEIVYYFHQVFKVDNYWEITK